MKKEEIITKLKSSYEQIETQHFNNDLISRCEDARLNQEVIEAKKKFAFPFKLIFPIASTCLIAGIIALGVTLPRIRGEISSSIDNPSTVTLTKAKSVISNEIMLASILTDNNDLGLRSLRLARNEKNQSLGYEETISLIHEYLLTGELLLNKENFVTNIYYNEDENHPYQYLMEVSYTDDLDNLSYKFYYSEYKRYEYDDEDDLDEISIIFEGELIIDNETYQVNGYRENEEDEYQIETNIYYLNERILSIEQETEINENEYTYTYYRNNHEYRKVSQEVEIDNNKKEMSISVEENNKELEFQFEYLMENKIYCEFELEEGDVESEIELMIEERADYYIYKAPGREDIIIYKD